MPDAESVYSIGERLMHRVALGNAFVPELLFDLERALYLKKARRRAERAPILVCGMARAGTTIIMRSLYATGTVASLTYRDMPFPLAPNLWERANGTWQRNVATTTRGHADGLDHDLDSPEAIEEAFWKCFCGRDYISTGTLRPHRPDNDVMEDFSDFMALVCLRYGKDRYLSKNNNNILRLAALKTAFPDAIFVHPFRDPLQQAASLLNQHRRALESQSRDQFRADYAAMLAHHEFGNEHRRWAFGSMPLEKDPASLSYWLIQWAETYEHLLQVASPPDGRHIFLDYDAMCADPGQMARLITALGLVQGHMAPPITPPPIRAPAVASEGLKMALQVHNKLQEVSFN